jgi:hypothetical protein
MSAAIFLLGAAVLGTGLMKRALGSRLNLVECLLFGLVVGWGVTAAGAYAAARAAGSLSATPLLIITATPWLVSIYLWFPVLKNLRRRSLPSLSHATAANHFHLAGLLCLFAPLYLILFRTHMLQEGPDGGIYSGGASASYDLGFHAALTTSFLYGQNFPPIYTAMPPAPLLYPFLPDFQTALLVSLGLDLHTALVITGTLLALSLTGIFYLFTLRLLRLAPAFRLATANTRANWVAALATVLFLFNGGFGFLYFIGDCWGGTGFLSPIKINYTNLAEHGIVWANIISDILPAQRTSLFGLCLGLIVFTLFAMAWREDEKGAGESKWNGWRELLVAGLITGLLPGFHPHSFAAVGIVSGFLFILRPRRVWIVFWAPALLLVAPHMGPLAQHVNSMGFLRFQPGWHGQGDANWLGFWLRNVGLPTLLIIPACFVTHRALRLFYLGFVGLLILSLLIVFSPNDYDNLKLMYYWYAATVVLVADWLFRLAARNRGLAALVAVVVLGSVASGGLAVLYELQSHQLMYDRSEVAVAAFVRAGTPPRSLFLTAPSLHQPILSLAGRAVVRGPTAWLWSHGYPFAEREADVRAIYAGRDDALDLLHYYQVDYVYLGPRERQDLKANQDFFDRAFPLLYRNGDIFVYDARPPGAANNVPRRTGPYPVREYASRVGIDPFQPLVEFNQIGYPLYRQLTVMLGRPPRYQEFVENLKTLGRDVYPGMPGWRAVLETNQRKLTESWRERPDFREPSRLADSKGLNAEKSSVRDYNAAYVLLHYFGYLKRDIESDAEGYNFWLRDLNRTSDYRGLTRAFIESQEYKDQTP